MGRGCLCSEGRIILTTDVTSGRSDRESSYRADRQSLEDIPKHYCFTDSKIVDEDIPKGKCIRRCNVCGKIFDSEK
ncbi:MAG: hypothetical protein WC503_00590 [Candidatus Shapirobacteria bacterium]